MLKTGDYITASEVKVLKTFEGKDKWTLLTHKGHGYIGMQVGSILTEDYDFVSVTETTFCIYDDDAGHLHLPENEGIFEMRCDNIEEEIRVLMADI